MNNSFVEHISRMLLSGKETIKTNPLLIADTGEINVKGDQSIGMDKKMEEVLLNYIKEHNLPVNVFSEEIGFIKYHPNPTHLIVFDPLDGSTNYKIGKNLLPYGLLISCYKGLNPKLKDIVASGAIEHTTSCAWIFDGKQTHLLDGNKFRFTKKWEASKSTPFYFDLYYKEAYAAFAPLAQQVHIRWNGSNISSLTYVMSEVAAGMGAYLMRPEEIGTMVSLIKGAGGVAVNLKEQNLEDEIFSTEKTYELVAGNKRIVEFIVKQLKTHE